MNDREQKLNVLIIDDEHGEELAGALLPSDTVVKVGCLREAVNAVRKIPDLIILDVMFPKEPGASGHGFTAGIFLDELQKSCDGKGLPIPPILLVSGQSEAAKRFAQVSRWLTEGRIRDILPKSMADIGWEFFQAVLRHKVSAIRDEFTWRPMQEHLKAAQAQLASHGIITCSPKMFAIWETIVNPNWRSMNTPVLIYGETGTGKELVANLIHRLSDRSSGPFVNFNVKAVTESLMESELFGHTKHAFTDAKDNRIGYFEAAHGGTIFIDEIGKMPQSMQEKLLRVLEYAKIRKVGATDEIKLDVRVVAATNRRLEEEIKAGKFLEDLFYRINVLSLDIPPLRARKEDMALLVSHFIGIKREAAPGCSSIELDNEVIRCFQDYAWPGNVRELKNAVDRILAKARPGETLLTFEVLRERFSELELPMLHRTSAVLPPPSTGAGQLSADLVEKLRGGDATIWSAVGTGYMDQIRGSLKALLNPQGLSLLQDLDQRLFPYPEDQTRPRPGPKAIHYYKVILYFALLGQDSWVRLDKDQCCLLLPLGETQATKVLKGLAGIKEKQTSDCCVLDNPFLVESKDDGSALLYQLRTGLTN